MDHREGLIQWVRAGKMTAFTGAGGKTTLTYFLAETLAGRGERVLVTTSTKIYQPDPNCYAEDADTVRSLWEKSRFAVIGKKLPSLGKLAAPDQSLFYELYEEADRVLVEADGSRHCPVKVPRSGEPVILPETDRVAVVMGLSALGSPLECCCFNPEGAVQMLGLGLDQVLREGDAARLLASRQGGRKGAEHREFGVILNQWDENQEIGPMVKQLADLGVERVFATAFSPEERCHYDRLASAGRNED